MPGKGSVSLEKYRNGEKLGFKASILAKCAECCHNYDDAREDCRVPGCPLYPYMPYNEKGKKGKQKLDIERLEELPLLDNPLEGIDEILLNEELF